MRRILVENARRKLRTKRGGDQNRVSLNECDLATVGPPDEILAVDEALERLARMDKVAADVVRLRFFAGLSIDETAAVLGISSRTADRYWAYARSWLQNQIGVVD
jgi:RNA polymerase sigma factor (TIGR02999 family)